MSHDLEEGPGVSAERPTVDQPSVEQTTIDGLLVLRLKEARDPRGAVREFYRSSGWGDAASGLPGAGPWVQINVTESGRGAVRGMHGEAMTKLVSVVSGAALGGYLDAREGSATYGAVHTEHLTSGTAVLVPIGVCNGFQALADATQYLYCFDREWAPGMAGHSFSPLSPALGIDWPLPVDVDDPAQISPKDRDAQLWPGPGQ